MTYYHTIASFTLTYHYFWCCHKTKQKNNKVEKRFIKERDKKIADLCWHKSHLTQRQLRHDEDLPLAQDLEVLHTLSSRERENKSCANVCVCVCTLALNQVSESNDSNFPPILPLSLSMPLFFIFVFRNGTISDIKKKKHTHTINGPSLSLWMEESRNL